jgi:3-oxoacyl-[acyl-carrier-protein] synthase-1
MSRIPGDLLETTVSSETPEQETDAALEVVAMGWATALGGLVQGAAAFRAGISRFQAARDYEVFEVGDEAPHGAIVSPASGHRTFGFVGIGRLAVLAMAAIDDLRHNTASSDWPTRFSLFVAVPDPWQRAMEVDGSDLDEESQRVRRLGEAVARRMCANLRLPYPGCRCFGGGRDATFRALAAAGAAMVSAEGDPGVPALVLSVDSLVAPACIEELANQGDLKTSQQPFGICPGEAAVAMLIRPAHWRQASGPRVLISGMGFAQEEAGEHPPANVSGRAGLASLRTAIRGVGNPQEIGLIITDHTGQVSDAHEWGSTLVGLAAMGLPTDTIKTWYTTSGFGEVGTAFGGVAIGLAMRGMMRGYVSGPAVIKAVGEHGRRAAALVSHEHFAPEAGDR